MWVRFLYMAVVSDVFVVLFSLQDITGYQNVKKKKRKIVFVFHTMENESMVWLMFSIVWKTNQWYG